MNRHNPSVHQRVLGVLAGEDMPRALLAQWAQSASVLLAADAGADHLAEAGLQPHHVIGDFDSTARLGRWNALAHDGKLELHHDPSQDTTDCDKLLSLAARLGYPEITLAGFEGDQLDHMLATLHSALRADLRVRLALRTGVGWVLRGGESCTVPTEPGRRVSLLPLLPCENVRLSGVNWPVQGSRMSPDGFGSISNRAATDTVHAAVEVGAALLFVQVPEPEAPLW